MSIGKSEAPNPPYVGDSLDKKQKPTAMAPKGKTPKTPRHQDPFPDEPDSITGYEDSDGEMVEATEEKPKKLRPSKASKIDKLLGQLQTSEKNMLKLAAEREKKREELAMEKMRMRENHFQSRMAFQRDWLTAMTTPPPPKKKKKKKKSKSKEPEKESSESSDEESSS